MNIRFTFFMLFVTLIVLCFFTEKTFAQLTLSAKTDFSLTASTGAQHLIFEDINSDGIPDAITGNQTQGGITILLSTTTPGASTPTFPTKTNFVSGAQCHGVAAGDINGDGIPDLATANTSAGNVTVFLNTTTPGASTPTLSAGVNLTTLSFPYVTFLEDINGDGKLDIIVSQQSGASIGVFLNTTTPGASIPTFSSRFDFNTAAGPTYIAVGDLNSDGKPDVAAACNTAGSISVLLNTTTPGSATPTFAAHVDFSSGTTAWSVIFGDFNLDGKLDMAGINKGANTMSVFLNTTTLGSSTPTFGAKTDFSLGSIPVGAVVTDFNNDGKPDLLVTASGGPFISVFLNTTTPGASTPTFLARQDFATPTQPYFVAAADLNGDGLTDIGTCTSSGNTFTVFLNTIEIGSSPVPSFGPRVDFVTGNNSFNLTSSDLNGDRKPDIICANRNINTISVRMNTTSPGSSSPTFGSITDFPTDSLPTSMGICDINGDGKPDLVVLYNFVDTVSIFINSTTPGSITPSFTARTDFATGNGCTRVSFDDINGDGKQDMVTSSPTSYFIFLNTTTPGALVPVFSAYTTINNGGFNSVSSIVLVDLNGDGKKDLAGSGFELGVMLNTTVPGASTPTFAANTRFFTSGNLFGSILAEDVNGDGKKDLIFRFSNRLGRAALIAINTTAIGATTPSFISTEFAFPYSQSLGNGSLSNADLNGDGKNDFTIGYSENSNSYLGIFLNRTVPGSTSASYDLVPFAEGFTPSPLLNADFNSDGKPDIVTRKPATDTFSVYLNTAFYPMPVELSSFTSGVTGNNVVLNWNTVSEENNSGFEIERNSFGAGWSKIGFIAGKGTVNTPQNYSFTDNGLNSGRYSYRLKQIDYNGNYKYYDLQNEVVIGVPSKFALMQNYPNPFNPVTRINYELPITNYVSLKIFDITGKEVKQLVNGIQQAGYYAVDFNAASLSSGTYFYKLTSDKFSDVKKMVVAK